MTRREEGRERALEALVRTDFGAAVDARSVLRGFRTRLAASEARRRPSALRRLAWWAVAAAACLLMSAAGFVFGAGTAFTREAADSRPAFGAAAAVGPGDIGPTARNQGARE